MPFKKFPNQFVPLPYDRHFQLNTIKSWTPALSTTKPSSKAHCFSKWIHLLWICKSDTVSHILNHPLHNFPYQNHYQDKSVIPLLYFPPLHSFPSSHSWFHPLLSRPTLSPCLSLCTPANSATHFRKYTQGHHFNANMIIPLSLLALEITSGFPLLMS